jgi:recombination protein RecA
LGVDLEHLVILNPDSLEQGGDVVQELLEEGILKGLVIDSWAALVPTAEYEDSLDKGSMGRNALCKNKFVRKMVAATKKDLLSSSPSCLIIIINHINMNIGVTFGSPETDTGGMGKNYFTSIRVKLTRIENINVGTDENKKIVGIRVGWKVTKNKTDVPYKEGTYDYYFALTKYISKMGIDRVGEIIEYAKKHGLIPDGMQRRTFEAMYLGKPSFQTLQNEIIRRENGTNKASAKNGEKPQGEKQGTRKPGRPKTR